jgi:hypothetical protein
VSLATLGDDLDGWIEYGSSDFAADARHVWAQAVAAPAWEDAPVWLHGDLHPANVIVSDGTLSGVIDFGELCAGDPARARPPGCCCRQARHHDSSTYMRMSTTRRFGEPKGGQC